MKIRCPKCDRPDIISEKQAEEQIKCVKCGHYFWINPRRAASVEKRAAARKDSHGSAPSEIDDGDGYEVMEEPADSSNATRGPTTESSSAIEDPPPSKPVLPNSTRSASLDAADLSELLLHAATPELYRLNAFRIAELPVDATERDIARQIEKLKMMEKFGGAQRKAGGPLPLKPAPDANAMRDAMQRLRDPEKRLVDELFWFWPQELGKSKSDPVLDMLARGDVAGANKTLHAIERQRHESHVAKHNLAVLAHAIALDYEYLGRTSAVKEQFAKSRDTAWPSAFKRWRVLLEHDPFWERLAARVREFDDPRLTDDTVRRMRSTLPLAILNITAQLAVQFAEQGRPVEVERLLVLVQESGFEWSVADEAVRRAVGPIRERLKMLSAQTETEAAADHTLADRPARRLLDQARPLFKVIDQLLAVGNSVRDGVHDDVASAVRSAMIKFGNKTDDWITSRAILKQAMELAGSESLRTQITGDIEQAIKNQKSDTWRGPGYNKLPPADLAVMEKARQHAQAKQWDEAITVLENFEARECDRHHVVRALVSCLDGRGWGRFKDALDRFQEPNPVVTAARSGGRGAATIFSLLGTGCAACGGNTSNGGGELTVGNDKFVICASCAATYKSEQTARMQEFTAETHEAKADLDRGKELDPANKEICKSLEVLEKAARELGISLSKNRSGLLKKNHNRPFDKKHSESPPWVKEVMALTGALAVQFAMCFGVALVLALVFTGVHVKFAEAKLYRGGYGPLATAEGVTTWYAVSEGRVYWQAVLWVFRVIWSIFAIKVVADKNESADDMFGDIFKSIRGDWPNYHDRLAGFMPSAAIALVVWLWYPSSIVGTWQITPDRFVTPAGNFLWSDIESLRFLGHYDYKLKEGVREIVLLQKDGVLKHIQFAPGMSVDQDPNAKKPNPNVQVWLDALSKFAPHVRLENGDKPDILYPPKQNPPEGNGTSQIEGKS